MTLPVVFTANGPSGYNLTNSLRFRASASAYLNRTPASAGSQTTWTISMWFKRGLLTYGGSASVTSIFGWSAPTAGQSGGIGFANSSVSAVGDNIYLGQGASVYRVTNAVFRDPSAWYHLVVVWDSTNATDADRARIYVNGVLQSYASAPSITQNTTLNGNSTVAHSLACDIPNGGSARDFFDGYLTEVNFIDGQALTPPSFGQTSSTTGVWQPIKYTGTYGTNGFYLPFTDNSALTTSSNVGLGKDFSGNGNYFATNNISITSGSTYDSMTDVPTLTSATAANYSVMNPLDVTSGVTLTEANLKWTAGSPYSTNNRSTFSVSSGKWYWEVTPTGSFGNYTWVGVADSTAAITNIGRTTSNGWYYAGFNGNKYNGSAVSYGATFTSGDVIGVALDMDAGTLTFYKNNVSQGTAFNSGLTGKTLSPALHDGAADASAFVNFGQRPFAYTPPTGFVALNTFNLPTPTIGVTASTQANKYMDISLYTGTGSSQSITGLNFQPDWTWIKGRSGATDHGLYDAVRGVQKQLESNTTDAETTETTGLTAFNSNGFTVGALAQLNTSTATYVGWNWKANGSGSSNTAGTITSTVSANTSAGFSIVTYTGNQTAGATVGHGLGVAPSMVIIKSRGAVTSWPVYHSALGATQWLLLNSTNAATTSNQEFNDTAPTSTVFSIGNSSSNSNQAATYVAYCFAQIAGYSAFGSYTGNGSTDGPFVFTGFRPRYVLVKSSSTGGAGYYWTITDTSRNTSNLANLTLNPDTSNVEDNSYGMDILSNGFKIRNTYGTFNGSGVTYIYMAFAENPFKYSLAR
jgi:hypothetical protein